MEKDIIENLLIAERGWVSRWPKKAVFIYSGGLDSTCTIAKVIDEYGVEIYPLFINRGQTNLRYEREAVKYFEKYLIKKYGSLFHPVQEICYEIPPLVFKDGLRGYSKKFGYPLRNNQMQFLGVQYAVYLSEKSGDRITTVLCSQVPDDPFPHSTLISLRLTTLTVCQSLDEWDWLITSPCIDHQLFGYDYFKHDLIKWADASGIPLEKTRSCYTSHAISCGECLTCCRRKEAFKIANVEDRSKYAKV